LVEKVLVPEFSGSVDSYTILINEIPWMSDYVRIKNSKKKDMNKKIIKSPHWVIDHVHWPSIYEEMLVEVHAFTIALLILFQRAVNIKRSIWQKHFIFGL
jgi:hypothetical protein